MGFSNPASPTTYSLTLQKSAAPGLSPPCVVARSRGVRAWLSGPLSFAPIAPIAPVAPVTTDHRQVTAAVLSEHLGERDVTRVHPGFDLGKNPPLALF